MGGQARQKLMGRKYGFTHYLYSKMFYAVKYIHNKWSAWKSLKKSIILEGNSKIGIHHSALFTLQNSKIIIHDGTLKVGIDFGYFDGGIYNPERDSCRITLTNCTLEIFGNVSLLPGVVVHGRNAVITIKNNTIVNGGSQIIALKRVEIGADCLLAYGVVIRDNDGHTLFTSGDDSKKNEFEDVVIGNHCWLGQKSMVLKGVTLENNVVVAAGAVVSKSVKSGSVVAGVPAKVIKENVSWQA